MITKKRAKELSLKIWDYLKDHPEIKNKTGLPDKLWNKIKDMLGSCPLCEYCGERQLDCEGSCPLADNYGQCSFYQEWFEAKTKEDRQKYATIIYDKINKWDITKRVKQKRMNKGY